MKYELAKKANQDKKVYAVLKELHVNDFIDSIIEEEKTNAQSSKQGGSNPLLLTKPYVNLSIHRALQDNVFN